MSAVRNLEFGVTAIDSPIGSVVTTLEKRISDIDKQTQEQEETAELVSGLGDKQKAKLKEWHDLKADFDMENDEHQIKMAWHDTYEKLPAGHKIRTEVDKKRKKWAKDDKKAGHPGEFNGDNTDDENFDYNPNTDQYKLQTGEALRLIVESFRAEDLSALQTERENLDVLIEQIIEHSNENMDQLVFSDAGEIDLDYESPPITTETEPPTETEGGGEEPDEDEEEQSPEKMKKIVDFSLPMMHEVMAVKKDMMKNVIQSLVSGEKGPALVAAETIFDTLPAEMQAKFDKELEELGYTMEEFLEHWKSEGMAEKMVDALKEKIEAKKREKTSERITKIDKAKVKLTNWKGIAAKLAFVGGVAALGFAAAPVLITGAGYLAAAGIATGAGIGMGGMLNQLTHHRKKKRKSSWCCFKGSRIGTSKGNGNI